MPNYNQPHQFYAGVDLHARSMFVHVLSAKGKTVFERDLPLMLAVARASGRPVSVGLTQARQYPDVWRDSFERIERATAPGVRIIPQVAPRSIGLMLGMEGLLSPLLLIPGAGDLLDKSRDELRVLLREGVETKDVRFKPSTAIVGDVVDIGYTGNLYDRTIDLEVIDWIRDQRKFPGIDGLKQQLNRDIATAISVASPGVVSGLSSGK